MKGGTTTSETLLAASQAAAWCKGLIEETARNPAVIFDSPETSLMLRKLKEEYPGEFFRLRRALKDLHAFPISELDGIVRRPGTDDVSLVDELIELGKAGNYFFHNSSGEAYCDVSKNGFLETYPVRSKSFTSWLRSRFYEQTRKGVSELIVNTAVESLVALAVNEGASHEVFLRTAKHEDSYLIDLADETRRCVSISNRKWEILSTSPVRFLRTSNMRPLPIPTRGKGNFASFWSHVNVSPEDHILVLAFLLESLRPDTPYTCLALQGEQGSAKTTTQVRCRDLIDPNKVMLRGAPKNPHDMAISAHMCGIVSYENLSSLSPQEQDMACMILTGGGIAARKLYSDFDEAAIEVRRPIIMNGIGSYITRPDLLDRTVVIELPSIVAGQRQESATCDSRWVSERAAIFTGLLDIFAGALHLLPKINIKNPPRMADFARLGEAVAQACKKPAGTFLREYERARNSAIELILDGDAVAAALEDFLEVRISGFQGTTKYLYEKLKDGAHGDRRDFPHSARGLGNSLRRLGPPYRQKGWSITHVRRTEGWTVTIEPITGIEHSASSHVHEEAAKDELVNVVNIVAEKPIISQDTPDYI